MHTACQWDSGRRWTLRARGARRRYLGLPCLGRNVRAQVELPGRFRAMNAAPVANDHRAIRRWEVLPDASWFRGCASPHICREAGARAPGASWRNARGSRGGCGVLREVGAAATCEDGSPEVSSGAAIPLADVPGRARRDLARLARGRFAAPHRSSVGPSAVHDRARGSGGERCKLVSCLASGRACAPMSSPPEAAKRATSARTCRPRGVAVVGGCGRQPRARAGLPRAARVHDDRRAVELERLAERVEARRARANLPPSSSIGCG
jgi:hypothetical protein